MKKYNRTFHLPFSQKTSSDDKKHKNEDMFFGKRVVVTEKMDGENTTIHENGHHARSLDSQNDDESRSIISLYQTLLKSNGLFDASCGFNIERIVGENVFYKHTIHYKELQHFFYCFNIVDKNGFYVSWKDFSDITEMFGLKKPNVIYEGFYDTKKIMEAFLSYKKHNDILGQDVEGFVVRNIEAFHYDDFEKNVGKYVDDSFKIETVKHWRYDVKTLNCLSDKSNFWTLLNQ